MGANGLEAVLTGGGQRVEKATEGGPAGHGPVKPGSALEGTVTQVRRDAIRLSFEGGFDGVIFGEELRAPHVQARLSRLQVGDSLTVRVVKPAEGLYPAEVSMAAMSPDDAWAEAQRLLDSGEAVELSVVDTNRGGLLLDFHGLTGFVPRPQIVSRAPASKDKADAADLSSLVGQTLKLKVVTVDRSQRQLVLSERQVVSPKRLTVEEILARYKEGDVLHGRISNVTDFGAFVDVGEFDGLVHVSELSWNPVSHPRNVVKPGDEVDVAIVRINDKRGRVFFSLKQLQPDPWAQAAARLAPGQWVEGQVQDLADFGAIVRLADGLTGLVHISELASPAPQHPSDALETGQRVSVRILRIDAPRRKIALSLLPEGARPDAQDQQPLEEYDLFDPVWEALLSQ